MFCLRPSGSIYCSDCSDSSVALRVLAFRKNALWFRYRSLAFFKVWCQSHDSVVVAVVRLEAFTIKWTFCFLPAVAARVMILVWGCYCIWEYLFFMWCDDCFHERFTTDAKCFDSKEKWLAEYVREREGELRKQKKMREFGTLPFPDYLTPRLTARVQRTQRIW